MEEDRQAQAASNSLVEVEEERQRKQLEQEADNERREKEKKRPKLNGYSKDRMVGDTITARPSTFATNKIDNFEYVELWYFSQEGCTDTFDSHRDRTTADETFGLSKADDGFMALKPVSSFKASRNVVRDIDLSWRQMEMGKNGLLHQMSKSGWAPEHISSLARFFGYLDLSVYRVRPNGEQIILTY